ncbi:hypothetical protein RCH14_000153 [Massilia sp. MP_M2]|uniref:hypothetical protein n=1 Tax=Massilia sp. MP_M2 TaxID=3071713 RepID=UPI00319E6121
MNLRTDRPTAAYVDLAVNISISFGLEAGLRVLREQNAPSSVVLRVLIMGGPRRGFTWARLEPSSRGVLRM